jgi:YVTN family beta-propeller protein
MRSLRLALLITFLTGLLAFQKSSASPSATLIVESFRELNGRATDSEASVMSSVSFEAFTVRCEGAEWTTYHISSDNPRFTVSSMISPIQCGSSYWVYFRFSPKEAGLTNGTVTFTSPVGTVTKEIIGNGLLHMDTEQWVVDLSPGTRAPSLILDSQRGYLYISDSGQNRILVFSPQTRSVVKTIDVGPAPVGLAMTPNHDRLYVANSQGSSISVVDLNAQQELYKIPLPSLGPDPVWQPWNMTIVSDTLALVGNAPNQRIQP